MLKTDNSSVTVDSSGSIFIISNTNRTTQGVGILATRDTIFCKIINHGKIMGAGQSRGIEIEECATVNTIINIGEITSEGHGIELSFNNSLANVNRGTEEFGIYNSGLIKHQEVFGAINREYVFIININLMVFLILGPSLDIRTLFFQRYRGYYK